MAVVMGIAALLALIVGLDRQEALQIVGLTAVAVVVAWNAARRPPRRSERLVLAVGLSLLGCWAIWQSAYGFDRMLLELDQLPPELRESVRLRLLDGRAFASQSLPGHFAVLLVLAVPFLVERTGKAGLTALQAGALLLVLVGLALSRSILGIGLAVLVLIGALVQRRHLRPRTLLLAAGAVSVLVLLVLVLRPDLLALEPFRLRWGNWRTAVWCWWQSPFVGVGPGGMAQAAQGCPWIGGTQTGFAHCWPLQLLVDHGLVGVGVLALGVAWLTGRFRAVWCVDRSLALALVVIPVHNLLDFSVYRSGVLIPWAAVVGWSLAVGHGRRSPQSENPRWRVFVVAALALGLGGAVLNSTARVMERTAGVSSPALATDLARRAARLAPWRLGPRLLLLELSSSGGSDERDEISISRNAAGALAIRPRSAVVATAIGSAYLRAGDRVAGLAYAADGLCWNPRSERAHELYTSIVTRSGEEAREP